MRLLADENLHTQLIAWLRTQGADVVSVAETFPGEPDEVVLQHASDDGRIVVTDDKDFGELVVHRRLAPAGVLLMRFRSPTIAARIARLDHVWESVRRLLPGRFVVVSDKAVRSRPIEGIGNE